MLIIKHGESGGGKLVKEQGDKPQTLLYRIWHHLLERSGGVRCPEFAEYLDFKAWALGNGYDEENGVVHLQRIDDRKKYEPSNLRFTTIPNSARIMLTKDGLTMCLCDWARYLGISKQTLWARLFIRHVSVEKALTKGKMYRTEE